MLEDAIKLVEQSSLNDKKEIAAKVKKKPFPEIANNQIWCVTNKENE